MTHIASFNTASFPDNLAVSKAGELKIGAVDDIQAQCAAHDRGATPAVAPLQIWLLSCAVAEAAYPLHSSARTTPAYRSPGVEPHTVSHMYTGSYGWCGPMTVQGTAHATGHLHLNRWSLQ